MHSIIKVLVSCFIVCHNFPRRRQACRSARAARHHVVSLAIRRQAEFNDAKDDERPSDA